VTREDFGRYLTQQRELRELSRSEVANATGIAEKFIASLEDGSWEGLPERAFVRNFLRAYAKYVGMAPDETVLRYDEIEGDVAVRSPSSQDASVSRRRSVLWAGMGLGMAMVLWAVVHWWAGT
jgi:cytoskeletal protein RodZ